MNVSQTTRNTFMAAVTLLIIACISCTYRERVTPIVLPDAAHGMVTVADGLKISSRAFPERKQAKEIFGFDIRKAGLLPVQVTFQNDSPRSVTVDPSQTFLLSPDKKAWPVLPLDKTYERTKGYVEAGEAAKGAVKPAILLGAAGAVVGLAVGIVTGENLGEAAGKGAAAGAAAGAVIGGADRYAKTGKKIKADLASKTLSNREILPGQIAYGVLFFPGLPEEASSVDELRLALRSGETPHIVRLKP